MKKNLLYLVCIIQLMHTGFVLGQNPSNYRIEDEKMIFHKVFVLNSDPNPFLLSNADQFAPYERFNSQGNLEVYGECPVGALSAEDFVFKMTSIGLLSAFRNNAEHDLLSSGLWGCYNVWNLSEDKKSLSDRNAFITLSVVKIIFNTTTCDIEVLRYSGDTSEYSESRLIVVSELKEVTIEELNELFSAESPMFL